MMKRQTSTALMVLMVVSLGCQTSNMKAGNNDRFIKGACAVGAAAVLAAGIAAVVDWFSETDDQMITRINGLVNAIAQRYTDTMTYFGQLSGIDLYIATVYKPFNTISDYVLHEFATHIWYKNSTQADYRTGVWNAKHELESSIQQLRKRIRNLEGKYLQYEDQQRLRTMRQLVSNTEELLSKITVFAEALEYHKSYFELYDAIDVVRNKYLAEITILESGSYAMEMEIKRSIVGRSNSQYPFKTFVRDVSDDIEKIESKIRGLRHQYEGKRKYAEGLVNCLVAIKSIVVSDPRYQEELYAWEQARLQQLEIEAIKMRAQAELERAQAVRQQNRILEQRNRIEREKLYQQPHNIVDNVDITVTMHL